MAAIQIPNLPVAISVTGTEQLEAVQSGTSVRVTSQQIANLSPAGTVTTVSVVTANGVSGSVADPASTPAISLTLGNITPTSVTSATLTGGTTASSSLTLQSTSGVGTTDSILFKVGNNGATTAMAVDSSGNVGIGTSSPSASAILDAQSTTKGVRFPNMTTTQKNAVSSPAAGLVVFDTTLAKLCVYSGAAWQTVTSV